MYLALDFIERHHICNASAMHIRQTDMALSVERKSHGRRKISIHSYMRFVELPKYHKLNVTAEDHRYTTLENTVIDIVIAAHARQFKPAIFSSMSELVSTMSSVGKRDRGWCTPLSTSRHYQ